MTRWCLLATLVLGCVTAAPAAEPPPVSAPFEILEKGDIRSGHIAVRVKINGKGPYRLIFDTGAPVNLLSVRIAKEADLMGPNIKRPKNVSPLSAAQQILVEKMELGGLVAADQPAIVMDHPTILAMAEMFGPIDGLVGFPLFARHRTTIDYQARKITFSQNGYEPTDIVQNIMTTMMSRLPGAKQQPVKILVPAAQWGIRLDDKKADDDEAGVTVAGVLADSPAARAGLKAGDRLLTMDGRWTDSTADCFRAAEAIKPGRALEVTVRRGGKALTLTITPAAGF
jgi:membrane-associated protease RseP (regulator of RpoE activity)